MSGKHIAANTARSKSFSYKVLVILGFCKQFIAVVYNVSKKERRHGAALFHIILVILLRDAKYCISEIR